MNHKTQTPNHKLLHVEKFLFCLPLFANSLGISDAKSMLEQLPGILQSHTRSLRVAEKDRNPLDRYKLDLHNSRTDSSGACTHTKE